MNNTLIINDMASILDSLLIYKMAAKILSEEEIDVVLGEGKRIFLEHFQDKLNPKEIGSEINGVAINKKQLILSMKEHHEKE